jgi:hypothetical protein
MRLRLAAQRCIAPQLDPSAELGYFEYNVAGTSTVRLAAGPLCTGSTTGGQGCCVGGYLAHVDQPCQDTECGELL